MSLPFLSIYRLWIKAEILMNKEEIILQTERLFLRKFNENDVEKVLKITADKDVMRYFPSKMNRAETQKFLHQIIEAHERDGHSFWAAELKDANDFVGMVGLLSQQVDEKNEIEIAYRVVKKYWRQGFASEAAQACRNYAFQKLKCTRLISLINSDNIASKGVANKIGMQFEKMTFKFGIQMEVYSIHWQRKSIPINDLS